MSDADAGRLASLTSWHADWRGLRVAVLGLGTTGFSVADTLAELGARVLVVAEHADDDRARLLDVIGAELLVEARLNGAPAALVELDPKLLVVSPGFHPDHPLLTWAYGRGIPIWGDVELAWRLRDKVPRADGAPAEWLCVTGTNGKTTTVQLTATFLAAAGMRAAPCGNIGVPVLDAIRDPGGFDVLVVELSSYQLHWLNRPAHEPGAQIPGGELHPWSAACLNIADDHLDWHGSFDAYRAAKAKVYANVKVACVYNKADEQTMHMVEDAEVEDGARAIGFGLSVPGPSDFGVIEGIVVDRAFLEDRRNSALELTTLAELEGAGLAAPHVVANILAASALARSVGVETGVIHEVLQSFTLDAHRIETVAISAGVRWVDDSKATNAHAAAASLRAFSSVVWIAGGLLKGVDISDLVEQNAGRMRGAVLIGKDRSALREAFARLAPGLPVREVEADDSEVMAVAVALAAELAEEGDTVLLAPAAASMDQFTDYGARGAQFAEAVRARLGL